MDSSWATFARSVDLHLELDRTARRGIRAGLAGALREAVRSGRLRADTRLPSSRALAADLGLARNTVADAYADLVAEGWLTARQGSATRVAPDRTAPGPDGPRRPAPEPAPRHLLDPPVEHNLLPGVPDLSAFPRLDWATATRRALVAAPSSAFGFPGPGGRAELRHALADYLTRARGVSAGGDRVLTCAGVTGALRILAQILAASGTSRIAVEPYGLGLHRGLLAEAGLEPVPLPSDEHGVDTSVLPDLAVGAVLLTPAHQFPTGLALTPRRRAAAIDWARGIGGLVLEDDYDGEFRYDRQPVGAMQALDPEHVVYLGTASKSLTPGLRLGWMVPPDRLLGPVRDVLTTAQSWNSVADELTLAEFLGSGGYDRHLRSLRQRYRRRRDLLVAELAEHAPAVRVTGIAAGLHALVQLPAGTAAGVLERATDAGLAVHELARFAAADVADTAAAPEPDALVIGYAAPPEHRFAAALSALCAVLAEVEECRS